MDIDWKPAVDGAIAVAGGALLDKFLVGNVAAIGDFMNGLPEFAGISLKLVVLGAGALMLVKKFIMK